MRNFVTSSQMIFLSALLCASVFRSALVSAQCTKDVDCKGDRICRDGACVDPGPNQATEESVESSESQPLDSQGPGQSSDSDTTAAGQSAGTADSAARAEDTPPQEEEVTVQPETQSDTEAVQSIRSRRRAGRAILISGIAALSLGLVFEAGWALEDCWYVYDPNEREVCELSSAGSALVIGGFTLIGLGAAAIVTGAIIASKAKREEREMTRLTIQPFVLATHSAAGIRLRLTF